MLVAGRPSLVLENAAARLVIDLLGGSFVDFHFLSDRLNPLVWNNAGPETEPRQMSHFLCLDRWGWPSPAEMQNGMPYHGEAGLVEWEVAREPLQTPAGTFAQMRAHLPIANLEVRRTIRFDARAACFTVTEAVTNRNLLGSVLNMVQHPSIGPPFLSDSTIVDASAGAGFILAGARPPDPEQRTAWWPYAPDRHGQSVNLRFLAAADDPEVAAFVVNAELGWVTAASPDSGLLLGYAWRCADYPWFNAWRRAREGRPVARGLEFGTTGLDWPHAELLRKGAIFGRPLYVHLDTGEVLEKSFVCFLLRIPGDYAGVAEVRREGETLLVIERRARSARELRVDSAPAVASLPES